MKTEIRIALYGAQRNNAVIRMPERKNPAVALQVDSLFGYIGRLSVAIEMIDADNLEEARSELKGLLIDLNYLHRTVEEELGEVGEKVV